MEFGTDISKLSSNGLPQYVNFLLDKMLCKEGTESFRTKILDRIWSVREEMISRGIMYEKDQADQDLESATSQTVAIAMRGEKQQQENDEYIPMGISDTRETLGDSEKS